MKYLVLVMLTLSGCSFNNFKDKQTIAEIATALCSCYGGIRYLEDKGPFSASGRYNVHCNVIITFYGIENVEYAPGCTEER